MTPTDPMPANPPGDAIDGERLVRRLRWRYSVKKFDRARKIAPEEWRALEDALVLTASSYGLQPWKFVVITDPATKEQLSCCRSPGTRRRSPTAATWSSSASAGRSAPSTSTPT